MGHRSNRLQQNQIAVLAALTYAGSAPGICQGQPSADPMLRLRSGSEGQTLAEPVLRFLGPENYVLEGAALVLLFFAIAAALPICSFITGARNSLYNRLSLTALSAAAYILSVSGLGAALLSPAVKWQYISLFFLWMMPAGICTCLQEVFAETAHTSFFRYTSGGFLIAAVASVVGVAADIAGFAFFVKLFVVFAALSFAAAVMLLIRALRTGKRSAETLLVGSLAVPGFAYASSMLQSFGLSLMTSYAALLGLLVLFGAFIYMLKLSSQSRENCSEAVRETKLSAAEAAPAQAVINTVQEQSAPLIAGNKLPDFETSPAAQDRRPAEWKKKVMSFAHEINTPLSTGLLTATHLQDEVSELSESFHSGTLKKSDLAKSLDSYKESSEIIVTNLETAAGLVRSFRNEAAEVPQINSRHFNVNKHLSKVLVSLSPRIKEAGHQLHYTCPDTITSSADPVVFSQIINNLVINSLTHAYAPGVAGNLSLDVSANQGEMTLTYSDDGKGIEGKMLDKIFEPYFTTNAGAGNSGLGLFIVHSLVTQHLGGKIECSSIVGRGTTFTLRIPIEGSYMR